MRKIDLFKLLNSMSLIAGLGLKTFLTLIFQRIGDTKTWVNFSATCKLARSLGKSLLHWEFSFRSYVEAKMPSGKSYYTSATLHIWDFYINRLYHQTLRYFRDVQFYKPGMFNFTNDRFQIGNRKINTTYIKLPQSRNDDIVVIEPKIIRKEVISEFVNSPYVKVRKNATRITEHRLSITGHYQQKIIRQGKGEILIVRYDEVDDI